MRVRNHISGLTWILTLGSLALVFGAVLQLLPTRTLPRLPDIVIHAIPHLNVVLSIGGIISIGLGWYWVRHGEIRFHRKAMLTATTAFLVFLTLYLYRVSIVGPTAFPGPPDVYRYVYLPLLALHILLAVICLPLLYYVLLIGLTHTIPEIARTRHPRIGRIVAPLWITSFTLGVIVYTFLYVLY